jgi:hypothetical protein
MTGNGPPPPPDPYSTPVRTNLPALEVEAARKALEVARVKEKRERKIRLKKQTSTELSEYHQWKWQKKPANKMPAC